MKRALIDPAKCKNCLPCLVELKCYMNAVIREAVDTKPWVDFYRCAGCMKCKSFCQNSSITEITHPCNGKCRIGW